ncbi:PEP-CTERM sorting domain-containing protein [Desertifilum sp. FACHB-1129]|nr:MULTISPECIES: choice-of-anchor tandem repeat NxxGxxAF-containing protein [Desertifilum]MBD2311634.1 PEP-CTERM sorting domain-containing protein [Desertifilum sp. FACHB-1129]MBD2322841.1 PEP-CTERM sorting domain-containing protein [Desertifilum sp. FACHB-866]MBD2332765.1 PEP-CTERM sorting domain-containing protein [Desertifilum sp. FACHB-868]MDA0209360.1 PEP-CTERM sorting domain-containing protein [Cyanobacteria bacterium FC1]
MNKSVAASTLMVGLGLTLLAPEPAQALSFTFTKIVDTVSNNYTSLIGRGLNNAGYVAYRATLEDSTQALFTSNGILTQTIVQTSETYLNLGSFSSPNDSGTVAFQSILPDDRVGIFRSDGTTETAIALIERQAEIFGSSFVSQPSINNQGTVAYVFSNTPFGGEVRTGDGDPVDEDSSGTGQRFTSFDSPIINDAGQVTYLFTSAFTPPILVSEIPNQPGYAIVGSGMPFSNLGPFSLNNQGTLAFTAYNNDLNQEGLFITNDGISFTRRSLDNISLQGGFALNDLDDLAFFGSSATQQGIYINRGDRTSAVVSVGDRIFDSSIVSLNFLSEGFNNLGQVAFFATLEDGTSGIFRADPYRSVPEPTSALGLLAVSVLGASTLLKRKSG